jgi:hypothetical protein
MRPPGSLFAAVRNRWPSRAAVDPAAEAVIAVGSPLDPSGRRIVRRHRWIVIGVGIVVLAAKLVVAATTRGTNDVIHWYHFAAAVAQDGPVGVYAHHFVRDELYNHPPAIGFYLEALNVLQNWGIPLRFTIRAVSSTADVLTAVLIFEILRQRRSLRRATASGVLVAASPVLFIISGFHGNTDPLFTMLVIAGLYLLAVRNAPVWAGCAVGLAVGIKVVPVIVIPAFVVYAFRRGRPVLLRFVCAMLGVVLLTWAPAVLLQLHALVRNVLGYAGSAGRQWGLVQFGHWAGNPGWVDFLIGPGRMIIVLICAAVPAWLVWRHPPSLPNAIGLSLGLFLALSPAFGHQYLAWPAAALFLVSFWGAAAYNLLAGALLLVVYDRWSKGFPWDRAFASAMTPGETVFGVLVWAVLCAVLFAGFRAELPHLLPGRLAVRARRTREPQTTSRWIDPPAN